MSAWVRSGSASGGRSGFLPWTQGATTAAPTTLIMGNPGAGKSMAAAMGHFHVNLSRPAYYTRPEDQPEVLERAARDDDAATLRDLGANPDLDEGVRQALLTHSEAHAGLAERADLREHERAAVLIAGDPAALAVLAGRNGEALDERFPVKELRDRSDLDLVVELVERGVDDSTAQALVPEWEGTFGELLECASEFEPGVLT